MSPTDPLSLLGTLGLQMQQLAASRDLVSAAGCAHEAIKLLRCGSLGETALRLGASLDRIEEALDRPDSMTARDALGDLDHLIRGFQRPHTPPEQRQLPFFQGRIGPIGLPFSHLAAMVHLDTHSLVDNLIRLSKTGRSEGASRLIAMFVTAAHQGDRRAISEILHLIGSRHEGVAAHLSALKVALEEDSWPHLLLKLVCQKIPLLIPGLASTQVNRGLILNILQDPPAIPESIFALQYVLGKRDGFEDPDDQGERRNAAMRGLFLLTSPSRDPLLPIANYWSLIRRHWPVLPPVIRPSLFAGTAAGKENRWDLFDEHLQQALKVAEDRGAPYHMRQEILGAAWRGYDETADIPPSVWANAYLRSLSLADHEPNLAWPVVASLAIPLIAHETVPPDPTFSTAVRHIERVPLDESSEDALASLLLAPELRPFFGDHLRWAWLSDRLFRRRLFTVVDSRSYLKNQLLTFLRQRGLVR